MVARTSAIGRTWPSLVILLADAVGVFVCLNAARFARLGKLDDPFSTPLIFTTLVAVVLLYIMDTYGVETEEKQKQIYLRTTIAMVLTMLVVIAFSYVLGVWRVFEQPILWRSVFPFGMMLFLMWAVSWRWWMSRRVRGVEDSRRWLVVGERELAEPFIKDFDASNIKGRLFSMPTVPVARMVATADGGSASARVDYDALAMLSEPWSGIVIADDNALDEKTLRAVMTARLAGTDIMDLTTFYERHWLKLPVHGLKRRFFIEADGFNLVHDAVVLKFKRVMDIVLSCLGLVCFLPLSLVIAILIRLDSDGPVLFRQRRAGLNGQLIKVYKFRTMRKDAERGGALWARKNDPRVTRVGRWLRLFRLDELPQMVNVLRGEMSMIGPRPERPEFITELSQQIPYYQMRTIIKPGISGWAQVNLPYGASVDDAREKLAYDLFYIKNHSLLLDVIIIFKTFRVILFGRGR